MIFLLIFSLSALLLFNEIAAQMQSDANAISQRPLMINQLNMQRSALKLPLLCQDSLLTSMAQQHASDMAQIGQLAHDLPNDTGLIPQQFCLSSQRMSGFGKAAENVFSYPGNGTAKMAMMQVDSDAVMYANAMNKKFLYVGVGVAYNATTDTYYWTQMFATGDYVGVSCTFQPLVRLIDAQGTIRQYIQPQTGLNPSLYPTGIADGGGGAGSGAKRGYYCTLIAYDPSPEASMTIGSIPYPTVLIPSPNKRPPQKPFNATAQQQQQQAALLLSMAVNVTRNDTLNSTLQAVGEALRLNSSLAIGLNGTDSEAYSILYNEFTSIISRSTTTAMATPTMMMTSTMVTSI